jgi:hypothetical protein
LDALVADSIIASTVRFFVTKALYIFLADSSLVYQEPSIAVCILAISSSDNSIGAD